MPEPKFTGDGPPPDGKTRAARGAVTSAAAEDVVASTEPDDDLESLISGGPAVAPTTQFKDGETILIHVLEDGLTANGRVWYRGQELEYVVGEQPYKDTLDIHGRTWLELSSSDQIRRWGQIMFGIGPWPGGSYEHEKALEAERLRGRTPPTIQQLSSVAKRP